MDTYVYEAQDKNGKIVRGLVEADSFDSVEDILKYNKLTPVDVRPFLTTEERMRHFWRSIFARIRDRDKAIFARQLATMINAGLSLMESLHALTRQTPNKNLVEIIFKIIALIEKGKSVSFAVAQFPYVFSPIFVSMVRSGEASGKMDMVLTELADQMESDYAMRSKMRGAMIYPAFIVSAMVLVGFFALVYIIPQLAEVFSGVGAALPPLTLFLITLSHFVLRFWYIVLILIIVFIVLIRYFATTITGQRFWGYMALKAPVVSKISLGIYVTNFSRTLSLLMTGGVPILRALGMVSNAVGNVLIAEEIKEAMAEVERGVPLSVPLSKSKYLPPLVASMVAVGEKTGQLDKILAKVASIYEEDTNNLLKGLTSLLEPVIMLIVGLGVAFLVLAILMPIFQLSAVF